MARRIIQHVIMSAMAGIIALAAGACGNSSSSNATADAGIFTMSAFPTGTSLDPWKAELSQYVAAATYDTLTHLNADGTVAPWLATSWNYINATTLVMRLRKDVVFTDGARFNAETVKANIEYGKSAIPSNVTAQAYLADIRSIDVVNSYEVRLRLSSPGPDLPYGFSQQAGWMVSPIALKSPDTLAASPAGSGPYILNRSETIPNQTYEFTRNPHYWASDKWRRFCRLVVELIADPAASDNAARSGKISYETVFSRTSIDGWKVTAGSPSAFFGFSIFDIAGQLNAPLGDVRVRRAMNYAIDRRAILKTVLDGHGVVNPSTPFGPDSVGYSASLEDYYTYDPRRAKELLAQAGYPEGFSLTVLTNPQWDQMAQALSGYLRKVGIEVQLSSHGDDFVQQVNSGKWAMAMMLQPITSLPRSDVKSTMMANSAMNPRHSRDTTIETLLADSAIAGGEAQVALYRRLAEYAASRAWFVVPALARQLHAHDPNVVEVIEPKRAGAPMLYQLRPVGHG